MNTTILVLFIFFIISVIGFSQNVEFKHVIIDSLDKRVSFHIQFLNSRFIVCDSSEASFKHYVYYSYGKPLNHYPQPPKFIKNYTLANSKTKEDNDSILLLDGKYSFYHRKKQDSLDYIYDRGFLVYERLVKALNKPTIYIPSFEVTPNYEYYIEERFYDDKYGDYFPSYRYESYILTPNMSKKKHQKLYVYYEDNKWMHSIITESE